MSHNPIYSRCSLGKGRWFWVVYRSWEAVFAGEEPVGTGYAVSPHEAEQAALRVVPNAEPSRAGLAAHHHRDLCNKRRAAQPNSRGTKAATQEFLYRDWLPDCENQWQSIPHLIVKKTTKRVFVEQDNYHPDPWDRESYALDRAELEAKGSAWSHSARDRFYTTPWEQRRRLAGESPDLTVLGVKTGASKLDIKAAYRSLARQHHPDCGGDPAKFKEIQEAYERAMAG